MSKRFFLKELKRKKAFDLPFRMFFQFIKDGSFTVFKNQMKFSLPSKDLNQIDQIGMLEVFEHANFSECNFLD